MIDGEIYVRTTENFAVFAYRCSNCSSRLSHYAAVLGRNDVFVYGVNGSCGFICNGDTRLATEEEVDLFKNKLNENGYHYNKANKKVIRINTGELL